MGGYNENCNMWNCGSIYQLSDDKDIRKFRCAECHGSLRYFDNEVNEHNNSHEIEESYNYNVNNKRNNSHFNSSIKSKSKIKILDILIIICIICASCFAIYHVTSDEYVGTSVNFDSSTTNRLVENYLNFYDSGQIIKSQVNGINSTNGEKVSINGTVLWAGDSKGYNVKVIINSEGHNYLVGLQKMFQKQIFILIKLV